MDLISILGGGAAAASGGIFGLFGSVIGAIGKHKQKKQEMLFQEKKWVYETKLLEMQMTGRAIENEHELAIVAQEGSWSALSSSMEADSSTGESYLWVNAIKSLFRPLLTSGLLICVMVLFFEMQDLLRNPNTSLAIIFSPGEVKEIMRYIINSMVFSATTAIVWWFGDRALTPPGLKR